MTLQVCLLGSDGFVMASDTKYTTVAGVRSSFQGVKIFFNSDRGMAWCGCGDDVTHLTCQKIEKNVREKNVDFEDMKEFLLSTAEEAHRETFTLPMTTARERQQSTDRVIVAKSSQTENRIWRLNIFYTPDIYEVTTKCIIGDDSNPCHFLTESYYPGPAVKTANLLVLAASVVIFGGRHFSPFVGGLEMVVAKNGKIEKLEGERLADIESRVRGLDDLIKGHIIPDAKQTNGGN